MAPHIGNLMRGDDVDRAVAALNMAFDALDRQLQNKRYKGDFIVGEFSLADLHWAPYAHICELNGKGDLISTRAAVSHWWDKVKAHKSTSKENFLASSVLPSADDIQANHIRSVTINV